MEGRITPENITELDKDKVFVYASNERGINGAGSARTAEYYFGAKRGKGFGYTNTPIGKTFAIPTKDWNINTLPLESIQFYVNRFISFAKDMKDYKFLTTAIGTGLAGFTCEQIAPLFKEAVKYDNIHLPQRFWDVLNKD